MKLSDIEQEMLNGNILPARLGELRTQLGGMYSMTMNNLEEILMKKPGLWNNMRLLYKSDKACDRAWDATEDGVGELHWKFRIKKIEKMMSSLRMQWDITNTELRNIT